MLAPTKFLRRQYFCINKIVASTKYWHQQNIGADKMLAPTKCWCMHLLTVMAWQSLQQLTSSRPRQQNIGPDKILALTKYWRRQNIGGDKMLVLTTCLHRQNFCIDKMLASPKYLRRENIGVDKMLAHARKHLFTIMPWQRLQQLTSPRPRWCSPTSPRMCWPPCFYGRTISCTVPAYSTSVLGRKRHKYCRQQNISARQDFTNFCVTIAANISALHPTKNWWKQRGITITVQYQFTYS